jgi:hypothetical protein
MGKNQIFVSLFVGCLSYTFLKTDTVLSSEMSVNLDRPTWHDIHKILLSIIDTAMAWIKHFIG